MSQDRNTSSTRAHVAWATDLPSPDRGQHHSPPLKWTASTDPDLEAERKRYRSAAGHAHVTWASDLPHPDRRRTPSPPVQQTASSDCDLDFERSHYSTAAAQSSLGAFVYAGSLLADKRDFESRKRKDSVTSLPPTALPSDKKREESRSKVCFR